jgi:(2Fe-2S) ferredoxin
VIVCRGPECGERRGSASLHAEIVKQVAELGLGAQCELGWQSCFGRCRQGPNVLVTPVTSARPSLLAALPMRGPGTALYNFLTRSDVREILLSHVSRGIIVRELTVKPDAAAPVRKGEPDRGDGNPSGESR